MRNHLFALSALVPGVILSAWAAARVSGAQEAFFRFIVVGGPSILFSALSVTILLVRYRAWPSVLLLLASPVIYQAGGLILFRGEDSFPSLGAAGEVLAPFVASGATAWAYLAATRMLAFRKCPWTVPLGWGTLAFAAGIPFVNPFFKLADDRLGSLWFWSLHVLIWYLAVGHAMDMMAARWRAQRSGVPS